LLRRNSQRPRVYVEWCPTFFWRTHRLLVVIDQRLLNLPHLLPFFAFTASLSIGMRQAKKWEHHSRCEF